jgi:hypothetical protein
MEIDIESLERATLEAVVPAVVETLPGWLIPMDRSTVGRAVSAVPLRHALLDPAAVPLIECRYTLRGLQAQFRVADVIGLANLHHALMEQGYTPQQPTLTLVGNVRDWPCAKHDVSLHISKLATDHWKSVYLSPEFDPVDGASRVLALSRSTSMCMPVCAMHLTASAVARWPLAPLHSATAGPACMDCAPLNAHDAKAMRVRSLLHWVRKPLREGLTGVFYRSRRATHQPLICTARSGFKPPGVTTIGVKNPLQGRDAKSHLAKLD